MKRLLLTGLFVLIACAGRAAGPLRLSDWELKSTLEVGEEDACVSLPGYGAAAWYPVTVPSTVLHALVEQGVYPDPRTGMNNFLIPDVSDDFNRRLGLAKYSYLGEDRNPWQAPYWYRTVFRLPREWRSRKRIWLQLDGINYRADVWVNGRKVGDREEVVGMFRRFRFDITECVERTGENCVAVKVYQVDHPGTPTPGTQFVPFGPNRGTAADLFLDETLKFTGGWDCAPAVRDRNMGIYQPVSIEATDEVTIEDPFVETSLPRRDTTVADLRVSVTLRNHGGQTLRGRLRGRISLLDELEFPTYSRRLQGAMRPVEFSVPVVLEAGREREVVLTPADVAALRIVNPCLWYPNGYGEQYLHRLELDFVAANGRVSDREEVTFGMREVSSDLMERDGEFGRVFYVNGRRIFCKGGWLQPDMLLADSPKRIYDQSRLLAEAHVTLVGSEDMPAPAEAWLDSWDKYGLMDWHVFYQCYRMFPGRANQHNPLDKKLAVACVEDMVKRYRNHPSIVAWFGVNEVLVDEALYHATRDAVLALDRSRPYVPTTSVSWDVDRLTPYLKPDLPTGTTDDGAPDYNWAPSEYYFEKIEEVHLQMFRNELGMPSVPTYESLRRFIPTVERPNDGRDPIFPLDSLWAEHGAWDNNNFCYRAYDNALRTFYNDPVDGRDYARKGQMVSAEGYRAMFEAANHRMWDITTGVMIWKLNSCWPDVCWQLYDWYLSPNASYYFSRKAMEPLHIQLNSHTNALCVVNAAPHGREGLVVRAEIVDQHNEVRWSLVERVTVEPDSYLELERRVPRRGDLTSNYFIRLRLEEADGTLLSENLYWRYSQHQSFYWLVNLGRVDLEPEVAVEPAGREYRITVTLRNRSEQVSFFNHLLLRDARGEVINPVFWSDNFVTLFPGESRTLTAVVAREDCGDAEPVLDIES